MTREEAIQILSTRDRYGVPCGYTSGYQEALDMAIEALQEPKTIIGIDIPYGNDKGIATIFKGYEKIMVLEEVNEIMLVVRCKDCKHLEEWLDTDGTRTLSCDTTYDDFGHHADVTPYHYCGYAERSE